MKRLLRVIRNITYFVLGVALVAFAALLAAANSHEVTVDPLFLAEFSISVGVMMLVLFSVGGVLGLVVGIAGGWWVVTRQKRHNRTLEKDRDRLKRELAEVKSRALRE